MEINLYSERFIGLGIKWNTSATSWKLWIMVYVPFACVCMGLFPRYTEAELVEMYEIKETP